MATLRRLREPSKQLIRQVATLLAVQAPDVTTIASLTKLLTPLGYLRRAIRDAYTLSGQKDLKVPQIPVQLRTFWGAYQYRAAYILASARRLTLALERSEYQQALQREKQYYIAHVNAHNKRVAAIEQTIGVARKQVGQQVLEESAGKSSSGTSEPMPVMVGWYAKMDAKTSLECRLADGKNFNALKGTIIGYPGSVHPHCRCKAGPPHSTKATVDDAVRSKISRKEKALA